MPLTPETLTRHELNGLYTEVVDSPNPDLVGIAGRVVVETMQTLHLDCGAAPPRRTRDGDAVEHDGARVRQVPKEGTTFEFRLPNDDADRQPTTGRDGDVPTVTDSRSDARTRTDEAAEAAKASGTTPKPVSSPDQPATDADSTDEAEAARVEAGEDVAYVTVDGTRLLSRPALRTENAGESTWR
jgi:ribonuclease P protein subunit POP4